MEAVSAPCIEWSVAVRSLDQESGDQYLVKCLPEGVMVAVVDGLGHGPEAAAAARTAVDLLKARAAEHPVSLLKRCHEALRPTRGAVVSLACFDPGGMTWLGVGNVDGVLVRADPEAGTERLLVRGGVVGGQLPALEAARLSVTRGDLLIFATDGVRSDFAEDLSGRRPLGLGQRVAPERQESPRSTANRILAAYGKATDDALVMVARYLGAEH
jgi:hypothetical protein